MYGNASCHLDINDIACPARAEGKISFLPVREAYPDRRGVYLCVLCAERDNQYLVGREVREIVRAVAYPVMPVVNATVVAVLVFIDAAPVCSFCLLLILYVSFKSYNMLIVQKMCQSRS
jgi:hypothetical protein